MQLPPLILQLFKAQHSQCFYCGCVLDPERPAPAYNPGWSREHVYPRATLGRAMANNVVIACFKCNNEKDDRAPTAAEIARAGRIYASIGRAAFIPAEPVKRRTIWPPRRRNRLDAGVNSAE